MNKQTVIISLGGSIIVPDGVDVAYVKQFIKTIQPLTRSYRFVIFTGGGSTARLYQQAARSVQRTITNAALDWIGIQASHINAELVKQLFGKFAHDSIITDPRIKLRWTKAVHIGAGWKPGRSTDYDAVRLAVENSISTVINLSNIDYVYTSDPRKNPKAEKITETTWKDFRGLIGNNWDPGLNVPFDPIAAKIAQKHNITVNIMNGKKLSNVVQAIKGKSFQGTKVANSL